MNKNDTSETGTFTTLNLPKLTGGDTWSINYNATDVVLTVDGPAAVKGVVSGPPAKRISRGFIAGAAADDTNKPVGILARATCFGVRRLMAPAPCGSESLATVASVGDRRTRWRFACNIPVADSNGEALRLRVLPSSVGHTIGCN
jgi:hypothetical protein